MTNDNQNITKDSLGRLESNFLTRIGPQGLFTLQDASRIIAPNQEKYVRQFLARLKKKGWIGRVKPGLFAVIPLSSGAERTPQIHEFLIAMRLVEPAAIAYFSAMNYHGLTEQLPRQVFIATSHKVARPTRESLGISYRIITHRQERFFGVRKEWINESPFMITDLEKTLIDGLAMPEYVGGVGIVAAALSASWSRIDEKRLHEYAVRIGISAVVKRLGFLLEALAIGNPEGLRRSTELSTGYPCLDPTLPAQGMHNRRWGLLVNAKVNP
jgi:predicted transcriptional regulator of viral defense system